MTSRRWLVAAGVGLALLLLIGRALTALYVDYQWYRALGAESIWRARAVGGALVWILSAGAGIGFVFANLLAVRRTVASVSFPRRVANLEIGEEVPPRYLTGATLLLSIVLGLIVTLPVGKWANVELVRAGAFFNETDPYFQNDLAFWVGWLPLETDLFLWSLIAMLLVTVMVVFLYAMTRSVRWERGRLHVSGHVRRHFAVLGALMLILLAWSYRLDGFELLNVGTGPEGVFTYLDHRVAKPVAAALALVSVSAALIVLITGWTGQSSAARWTVVAVLALSLVLHQLGPLIARRVAEPRDPDRRERPYLATRSGYTRRAYAVDRIATDGAISARMTPGRIASGVPLWDARALALAASTRESASLAIGWRAGPAGLSALVARTEPSDGRMAWSLLRYDARHGDDRGAPVRLDDGDDVALSGRPPLVYPDASGYLLVADSAGTLAAPALDRPLARLAHAWSLQNFRLLFDDLPHPSPRVVLKRGVRERLQALMPFFVIGSDIAPVASGDSLLWAAHIYSAATSYPLSRRFILERGERAYFHHAAVAIVHAATGRVTVYPDSAPEPLAGVWFRRFPAVFDSRRRMSPDLAAAIPPPAEGVRAQALAFAATGSRTEAITRHLAWSDGADSLLTRGPVTPLFVPDDRGRPVAGLTHVLLDNLERVDGLLLGLGGMPSRTWWIPADGVAERWPPLLDRFQRFPDTAATVGALARGPVRAIPAPGGPIFAQTAYVLRPGLAPSVAHLAIIADGQLLTGTSVPEALGVPEHRDDTLSAPRTPADFRARATQLYDAMRRAMQRGDWRAFGEAYEALGRLLGRAPQ